MRILVVHSWGLGDLIMATPMLRSLASSGHIVDIALFSQVNQVLLKGNDFLNNIFVIQSKMDYLKLLFRRYDVLIATAGMDPQKVEKFNVIVRAKDICTAKQEKDLHRIEMNLKIAQKYIVTQIEEPYIYINDNEKILQKYLQKDKKNIAFAVGSGANQKFKRWWGFEELSKRLDGNILVFIGPDEKELKERYEKLNVKIVEESLEDTIKLIASMDLVIGNDNGVMHMAYATKCNSVTIYGMTNEKETGGYRKNSKSVFLDMECRPCFDPATDRVGCDTYDCLSNLSVERVWRVSQQFLS